jgi:hypothetical protein
MTTEFEPTTERWQLGVEEDNPSDGIRVVDCQDVTIATIWKQPHDPERWAVSNAQLFAAAKDLLDAAKEAIRQAREYREMGRDVPTNGVGNPFESLEQAIARAETGD